MANRKEDLRIKKTQKALADAIFELLETTCFDDISIIDICNKANVHRATFYKHYTDKNDFIEQVTNEKLFELFKQSIDGIDITDKPTVYKSIIRTSTHFIYDHKKMFRLALGTSNVKYYNSTVKIVENSIKKFISDSDLQTALSDIPTEITAAFITGGLFALFSWWITKGDDFSPEEIDSYLERLVFLNEIRYNESLI